MNNVAIDICKCMKEEHNVFSFLDDENAEELCEYFGCKTASAGEILWAEGDPCDYIAIIVSGHVEVKKQTEFKDRHVVVGVIGGGSIVGALCIMDGHPRAVTAEAIEDISFLTLTRENYEKLIRTNPEAGVKLLKGILYSVSIRLRSCYDRVTGFF
jgi:CRP/FNR family cyclic AMP-dependent transcriptional regulator